MADQFVDGMKPALFIVGADDLPGCRQGFNSAKAAVSDDAVVFSTIDDDDHSETALEIGTKNDRITPLIVNFLRDR